MPGIITDEGEEQVFPEPERAAHQQELQKALSWQEADKLAALQTMLPTVPGKIPYIYLRAHCMES